MSTEKGTERGQQIDRTHFAVQVWDTQPLDSNTLYYQHRQIAWSVRRHCVRYTFTGRDWREADKRFAEAEVVIGSPEELLTVGGRTVFVGCAFIASQPEVDATGAEYHAGTSEIEPMSETVKTLMGVWTMLVARITRW